MTKVKLNKVSCYGGISNKWPLKQWNPGLSPADPLLFLFYLQCYLKPLLSCPSSFFILDFNTNTCTIRKIVCSAELQKVTSQATH